MYVHCIAEINLSADCTSMLSPLSSSEFLNVGVVLGTPSQGSLLLNLLGISKDYILKLFYLCSMWRVHF